MGPSPVGDARRLTRGTFNTEQGLLLRLEMSQAGRSLARLALIVLVMVPAEAACPAITPGSCWKAVFSQSNLQRRTNLAMMARVAFDTYPDQASPATGALLPDTLAPPAVARLCARLPCVSLLPIEFTVRVGPHRHDLSALGRLIRKKCRWAGDVLADHLL